MILKILKLTQSLRKLMKQKFIYQESNQNTNQDKYRTSKRDNKKKSIIQIQSLALEQLNNFP